MSGIFRDLVSGFNSPATLINPRIRDETAWHYWPRKGKAYQCLARKAAGFCLLLSFGISLETIQLMVAWCCSVWGGECARRISKRDEEDAIAQGSRMRVMESHMTLCSHVFASALTLKLSVEQVSRMKR